MYPRRQTRWNHDFALANGGGGDYGRIRGASPSTAEGFIQPMTYFESMLQILWLCFTLLVQTEPLLFGLTLLAGVILAALCWWAATHYSRLFNLTFQITRLHQILCAGAAMLTLIFCLLFRKPEIHQTDRSAGDRQLESRNND